MLYVLRTALGDAAFIGGGTEQVGLDPARVWCDVVAFEEAIRRGDHATALDLYGGALCEGLFVAGCPGFEGWLSERRDRLWEQYARAAWNAAKEAEATGDLRAACRFGARALRHDPDEERLQWLLVVHDRIGDRIGAIRLLHRFERDLAEQYDLEVSSATRAIMDRIMTTADRPADPSRLAADSAPFARSWRNLATPDPR